MDLAGLYRRSYALLQKPHAEHGLVQLAGSEHLTNPGRLATGRKE